MVSDPGGIGSYPGNCRNGSSMPDGNISISTATRTASFFMVDHPLSVSRAGAASGRAHRTSFAGLPSRPRQENTPSPKEPIRREPCGKPFPGKDPSRTSIIYGCSGNATPERLTSSLAVTQSGPFETRIGIRRYACRTVSRGETQADIACPFHIHSR